ncbi:fibrobacter succinogenes major paralogous domain-containing protein [Fibrobacter sp. UWB3]|uniref:fibrobacter succinogenes major paralogous domain-containing protein n=1 Tax=Fibrobacter sp. UWB3 TaxID=1964357 RepID=UPI0020CCA5AD|nr:fibrobacter succinogenes major paralogous domain-containing protein [Fibrobacter sp. UWB3]
MKKFISKSITLLMAIASVGMLSACLDDKVAGGVTEDAGLAIKDLDVAGLAQKGPFVKGSVVTVQGVNCKTMKFTEEEFTGKVKSNKGDFGVDDVNLSATCALFAVSGYYMNEFTGEKSSDKLTLHAITDLKDRKHVNINVLTELEYERVMKLVSKEKMSFDDAKMQAEKEILTALGLVDRFESFEGLSIYEKGDGNAALLATSVMLQSDLDAEKLTDRLDGFASSITESGEWDDEKTKKKMTDWADSAKSRGKYETIRDNLEKWSDSDEIPDFEKVVDEINKDAKETTQKIPEEWSWDVPQSARLNPNIKYDSMVDPRDKQVYKVVKIDVPDTNYSQVWMAENLNYADSVKTPSLKGRNWCYNDDEKNCNVSGRYYSWAAAIDSVALANDSKEPLDCGYGKKCGLDRAVQGICPEGWHLPTLREWSLLCEAIGDYRTCGEPLKALTGWNYAGTPNNNGTDLYGFAALPTGRRISATSWEKVGSDVYYWSSTEQDDDRGRYFNINNIYTQTYTYQNSKYYGQSVRCVKD